MTPRITLLGILPLLLFMLVVLALLSSPFLLARFGIRVMRKRGVERFKPLLFIAAGLLFVAILINVVPLTTFVGYGIHLGVTQRHRLDHTIENDLPEIAEAALSLRHYLSDDEFYIAIKREDPRMPKVLRKTKCRDAGVRRDFVQIEMHGGFDHFGIRLQQDRSDSNVWQVLRYREGGSELLMTITNEQGASSQAVLPFAAGAAQARR